MRRASYTRTRTRGDDGRGGHGGHGVDGHDRDDHNNGQHRTFGASASTENFAFSRAGRLGRRSASRFLHFDFPRVVYGYPKYAYIYNLTQVYLRKYSIFVYE